MSLINCARPGCRDVFHAFLVEKADYEGFIEIPGSLTVKLYQKSLQATSGLYFFVKFPFLIYGNI